MKEANEYVYFTYLLHHDLSGCPVLFLGLQLVALEDQLQTGLDEGLLCLVVFHYFLHSLGLLIDLRGQNRRRRLA